MIARPTRRTGPIPFAPFPPLGERPLFAATQRDTRDMREPRPHSRWLPAQHAEHTALNRAQPHTPPRGVPSSANGSASLAMPQAAPVGGTGAASAWPDTPRPPQRGCHAIYHGQGTLSVLSSVTGHHYRFEGRGCTLTIDPRDRLVLGRLNELSVHTASA